MAISSTSFKRLTADIDEYIEDNLDALEAQEEELHDVEDQLDEPLHKIRKMKRELTRRQRLLIREIKGKIVGANRFAEGKRRAYINNLKVNGGNVTFNQE